MWHLMWHYISVLHYRTSVRVPWAQLCLLASLLDCVNLKCFILYSISFFAIFVLFYFLIQSKVEALLPLPPWRKHLVLVSVNAQRRRPINKTFVFLASGWTWTQNMLIVAFVRNANLFKPSFFKLSGDI